jgi:uncharacterized caspase-like protein
MGTLRTSLLDLTRAKIGVMFALSLLVALCAHAGVDTQNGKQQDEKRVALVVGNAAYRFGALKNPLNDARAMATTLQNLGFNVTLKLNADLPAMLDAMRTFLAEGKRSDVRLFYYAGHGVQLKGKNYLIPVDAEILNEEEIANKSADLNGLIDRLGEFTQGLNILVLDACRNNPFSSMTIATADGRVLRFRGATPSGLATMAAPQGTLVAFSTAPGSVAMDGVNAANSLYTQQLLANIETPGVPIEQLFKRVRMAVATQTKRMQIPWENSSIMGEFCFKRMHGRCLGDENILIDPSRVIRRQ